MLLLTSAAPAPDTTETPMPAKVLRMTLPVIATSRRYLPQPAMMPNEGAFSITLPVTELSADQKKELQRVLAVLVEHYRKDDQDEALRVSGPGDPLPDWLLEDWPAPELKARIANLRRVSV